MLKQGYQHRSPNRQSGPTIQMIITRVGDLKPSTPGKGQRPAKKEKKEKTYINTYLYRVGRGKEKRTKNPGRPRLIGEIKGE